MNFFLTDFTQSSMDENERKNNYLTHIRARGGSRGERRLELGFLRN